MGDVLEIGPNTNMTVEECLEFCRRTHRDYQDVMVIGYDHSGNLVVRSSAMNRQAANWLVDAAKLHTWEMLDKIG